MNILLANMPIQFNSQENLEPPLGIAYLASVLEQAGERVYLRDFEVERFSPEELESFIIKREIDLIGVSFRTASYRCAKQFILAIKKMKKVPLLIVGGHHATAFPEHTLKDLDCDISVRAEAEGIILELVKALENKQPLYQIKGISFRDSDKIITTPKAAPVENLDNLPYPARHLLPLERYSAITILTSRGCPFSCIYCDKGVSTRQVKFRSPENVYNEILEINRNCPGKRIYFVDDHFFLAQQRLNKIFDLIEKNGLKFNWVCQARADGVNLNILRRAKGVGCELIMYGIESGDPQELEYIKKQTTVEQARKAVFLTKEAGIRARANFMLGFPISTHNTTRNTIRFAKSVPLEVVRFFSVAPLPNTELWDRIYGRGTDLNKVNWDEFDFYTPTHSTAELSQKDILGYVGAAYIHILKKKVFLELSVTFLPRFIKLLRFVFKKRRIRGFISLTFPSTVNLLLDLKTVMHSMALRKKIGFLTSAFYLERNLCKAKQKSISSELTSAHMEKYYQTSEAYYQELQSVANEAHYSSYLKYVNRYSGNEGKLLDLGCGIGVAPYYFSFRGFSAYGIDLSLKFISHSKNLQNHNLNYICGNVSTLPFKDKTFDIVGSFDVLEHIVDVVKFLKEGIRVLKDEGIYIIICPCVLTPFTPLKAVFSSKKGHSVYTNRWNAFLRIFINLYLIIKKKLSHKAVFYYRKPILDEARWGKDEDTVYQASPIDLRRFLKESGLRILHYQNDGPDFLHRIVGKILPDFASTIYIVARKNGKN